MALSDVLGPIRRRWYILLVGLLLAAGMGYATAVLAPAQYTARGLVMLLPSAVTTGPKGNPLLNLGGLELPARVLIAYYSSEPAKSELEKFAPKAEVDVSMEESTRGPIIAVDVKDVTSEGALGVLNHVTDSIPDNLARIQSEVGTAKRAAISSMPLVLDAEAERDISGVVRLVVASVVAMLALTFFVVFSLDGIMLRRAGRDNQNGAETTADTESEATEIGPDEGLTESGARADQPLSQTIEGDTAPDQPVVSEDSPSHATANGNTKGAPGKGGRQGSANGTLTSTTTPSSDAAAAEQLAGDADHESASDETRTSRARA